MNLTPLSITDKDLLLAHLVLCQPVVQTAINKLKPEHFNQPQEFPHQLIWSIASNFYLTQRKMIPMPFLIGECNKFLSQDPGYYVFRESVCDLLLFLDNIPPHYLDADAVVQLYLQPLLNERAVMPMLATASVDNLDSFVESFRNQFSSTRTTSVEAVDVFGDDWHKEIKLQPATATGSELFDRLTGGGFRSKHLTGCLAPFGGGKTQLALEVCCGAALNGHNVFLFEYEQSVLGGGLGFRALSSVSGIPTSRLSTVKFEDLTPEERERLDKSRQQLRGRFHVFDMQEDNCGCGGSKEVISVLNEHISRGIKPDLVAIDWLGVMVKRFAGSSNTIRREDQFALYEATLRDLRYDVANAMECEVLVNHQLNAEGGLKKPGELASMYEAADFKRFAELVDTCIMLGTQDINGCMKAGNVKNRGVKSQGYYKSFGDLCRFRFLSNEMIVTHGGVLIDPERGGHEAQAGAGYA